MSGLVLGIDGGGTQTRVLVAEAEGSLRGEGQAGACNIAAVPVDEAISSVRVASALALASAECAAEDIRAVCAGVAGFSFVERRSEFAARLGGLFPRARIEVEPDYKIALIGATEGAPGLLVISGTGSVAYGENAHGQSHKAGAYGYLIDDSGSGYGVGRAALAAVLRAEDGTGEPTSLTPLVYEALGTSSAADIIAGVYGGGISRVQIAGLSRPAAQAAAEGDALASAILMRAGGALAQLVHGVTATLFPDAADEFPVACVGGLWAAGSSLTDVFERSVRRFAPRAVPGVPHQSPVWGAVRLAESLLAS